ncbi:hypothetical protein HDU67_000544 [Dinochytrium kinnereticum]|nr:hypothetical protein HDU67_000544 [Dinochytrium kinnereticum]
MAFATILFGWPAFFYPEEYKEIRGVWGLTSMIVVLSPTVGASLTFGVYRILGTLVGALFGYISWIVAPHSPYIFLNSGFARFGTTALITMNIITLNAHQSRGDIDADTIWSDTWKRLVVMLIGVTTAIILSTTWWPYVARIQLRNDLARSLNALGVFYSLIVVLLMDPEDRYFVPNPPQKGTQGPLQIIIQRLKMIKDQPVMERRSNKVAVNQAAALANREAMDLESKLIDALASHKTLLELAASEPRLKAGFPTKSYEGIIQSMQVLLDRLMSVRHLIKNGLGDVHNRLILPIAKYRRDMVAAILLYIYVLNGSMASRTPLPIFMPAARATRLRVLSRLPPLSIPQNAKQEDIQGYSHFFAFCLMQQEIIEELEKLAGHIRSLFGQSTLPYMKESE